MRSSMLAAAAVAAIATIGASATPNRVLYYNDEVTSGFPVCANCSSDTLMGIVATTKNVLIATKLA
jgi:outer membrane protein assembly factor BamE (lipoprotein component of BamABCDE complex)